VLWRTACRRPPSGDGPSAAHRAISGSFVQSAILVSCSHLTESNAVLFNVQMRACRHLECCINQGGLSLSLLHDGAAFRIGRWLSIAAACR